MTRFSTSRSRRETTLRCPRARYVMDEWFGTGLERVGLAVPLVTGGSVHVGLAELLRSGNDIQRAVDAAITDYEHRCTSRNFELDTLEQQSYVFGEQRALTEALVRVAGLRIVPKILAEYEVLEVEQMDMCELISTDSWRMDWRSIPDALLRSHESGELFILSWKTTTEYSQESDERTRVDMQGMSEPWALEQRIGTPVRGIIMVYLVKGPRRKMAKEHMLARGLTEDQISAGGAMYKQASPLIYGYRNRKDSPDRLFTAPELAWASEWHCVAPHAMRKSQWYPNGQCPGDGRTHKRGDEWRSFPVWEGGAGSVKTWIQALDKGLITPEAGDPLDLAWAMPVPHFRSPDDTARWIRQTREAERRIAVDLTRIRAAERMVEGEHEADIKEAIFQVLDEELDHAFPQRTEACGDWFHRKCPAWDFCHGPVNIRRDPLGSGIYQIKNAYVKEVRNA